MNKVMFSKKCDEWETPQDLYNKLDEEFHFTLDPCATEKNHKCEKYYTQEQDGLKMSWGGYNVFCNPPYSQIAKWAEKCCKEGHKENTVVVMLIPSRTDTKYFHDYIYHKSELRFIRGRIKFGDSKNTAPFPSMIVIYRGEKHE